MAEPTAVDTAGSGPTDPTVPTGGGAVEAGRAAFARRAWPEAFERLTAADATDDLTGADFEMLADAAFFAARPDARVDALERAFSAYRTAGDDVRAAFVALEIAHWSGMRGKTSVASGWARRAERLLDGHPETYAHASLALVRSGVAKAGGDLTAAEAEAETAVAIAERAGDADLRALALSALAMLRIALGATADGMDLLEEAAMAAVDGDLSPIVAGTTSCTMISACRDLTDYERANQWLEATDRWCKRQEVAGFPGVCRVHRAEILALQGGWERAEQELRKATAELATFEAIPPMADGMYALGDIRRLQGDVEGAEEALRQAHSLGRTPQPALALLRLGTGNIASAVSTIEAALADSTWDQWARARLLAAQVEIALAAGAVPRARAAVDELAGIVAGYPAPALEAGRQAATGRVLLAEGDTTGAVTELRRAVRAWRDIGAPYEVARARAVLSDALRAGGDDEGADLELHAARDEFARLGAGPDLLAAEVVLRARATLQAGTSVVRLTFMFTDIEGSTALAETLGDVDWERLLAWHDSTLRGLIAKGGGQVVNTIGDGFFAVFREPEAALAVAGSIQAALAEHRRATAQPLTVRIGLHAAEATQRGADYSGIGVHVAARIAALGAGGEIVASADTLAAAGRPAPDGDVRLTTIKGVSAPVRVATVAWT